MKVNPIQKVVPITKKNRRKQTKEDFHKILNKPPDNVS